MTGWEVSGEDSCNQKEQEGVLCRWKGCWITRSREDRGGRAGRGSWREEGEGQVREDRLGRLEGGDDEGDRDKVKEDNYRWVICIEGGKVIKSREDKGIGPGGVKEKVVVIRKEEGQIQLLREARWNGLGGIEGKEQRDYSYSQEELEGLKEDSWMLCRIVEAKGARKLEMTRVREVETLLAIYPQLVMIIEWGVMVQWKGVLQVVLLEKQEREE